MTLHRSPAGRARAGTFAAFTAICALATAVATIGCSDDGTDGDTGSSNPACEKYGTGQLGLDRKADMQVYDDTQLVAANAVLDVSAGGLTPGSAVDRVLTIKNLAGIEVARPLKVESVSFLYTAPDGASEGDKPSFECFVRDSDGGETPCTGQVGPSLVPSGFEDPDCIDGASAQLLDVIVRFNRPADNLVRAGSLVLTTNGDADWNGKQFKVHFKSKIGFPSLKLTPDLLDFGTVKLDADSEPKKFSVTNAGEAPLIIDRIDVALDDAKAFRVESIGDLGPFPGGQSAVLTQPLEIGPGGQVIGAVIFSAIDGVGHISSLKIYSNDSKSPHLVNLRANMNIGCLNVFPKNKLSFGFVGLGNIGKGALQLVNCGSEPVTVHALDVLEDAVGVFKLDFAAVDGIDPAGPTENKPITIPVNETINVPATCTPEEAKIGADGKPAPYTALVALQDNTVAANKQVALECWGTTSNCPTAIATSLEGEQIIPQQELHLVGSQSFAGPGQKIVKFKWTVLSMPKGAEGNAFWPNDEAPDPQFGTKTWVTDFTGKKVEKITVNVAGEYKFGMQVLDDTNTEGCIAATFTVLCIPDEQIHVELLWDTPDDVNKTDDGQGAGADMDLHFTHPNAELAQVCENPPKLCNGQPCVCQDDLDKDGKPDPWFHTLFDCFWFNPDPNWGSLDPGVDDNPGLDLDDTDGWGPENMNLANPQNSTIYQVGVHYWDDHGYGESVATVRIYIVGQLAAELISVSMNECDFWWVKRISWPDGTLLDVDGKENGKVTKSYFPKFAKALGATCSN